MTDIFPTKVLLATDGSDGSEAAIRMAAELADKTGSELHLVHVGPLATTSGMDSGSGRERMEEETDDMLGHDARRIEALGGNVAEAHHRRGDAAESIVSLGKEINAGVIVVGSRGLGGLRRIFEGSVSDQVVREAHCPVMVVREEN